jgi:threonylcarbamoyladenosine tRNA methylthiotransferase MtaB
MPSFSIHNFGCRATQADADAIEGALVSRGYHRLAADDQADLVVLNTCTVTAAADAQTRDAIRKIHRANPLARIVVTGCYAQRAPEELASIPGVSWVVGNSHQAEIPRIVDDEFAPAAAMESSAPDGSFYALARLDSDPLSIARAPAKIITGNIFADTSISLSAVTGGEGDRTRPILKVQDGCNQRCAYCVIPLVRGRSRSLPPDAVIAEICRLANAGAKEIVLSGINLGSYGRDLQLRAGLSGLVSRVLSETPLQQLRFSSIEPMDVTQDFVDLVASSERLAPHFHMPLQSGSDRVLRNMHRWYRADHYARRLELIHERLPSAAIGADVIVGFPGESEADFQATLAFVAAHPFSYLHVFSYSARPGTAAAQSTEQVSPAEIRVRARALRALAAEKAAEFRGAQAQARGTLRGLTLHRRGENWTEALTGNYLKMRIVGHWDANQWVEARVSTDPGQSVTRADLWMVNDPSLDSLRASGIAKPGENGQSG